MIILCRFLINVGNVVNVCIYIYIYIYIYIVYLNNLLCPLLISYYSEAILINYMPTLNQRSC